MSFPQDSNTPARPNDTQAFPPLSSNGNAPRDLALEAAVRLVGEKPGEAARLAEELGLSFADTKQMAQDHARPAQPEPFFFEWHQNLVQETLQVLHDTESAHRAQLEEVIAEMRTSEKFWHLFARFDDVLETAPKQAQRHRAMLVMFARMYTAGSLRNAPVFDEDRVAE